MLRQSRRNSPLLVRDETVPAKSRCLTEWKFLFLEEDCMSLRDFNNAPFSDDPTALHNAPSGNGTGLDSFHTTQPEDIEPNNMSKLVGAVAVALMIGAAGVALYASSGSHQAKPVVAANMPSASAPVEPAPAA